MSLHCSRPLPLLPQGSRTSVGSFADVHFCGQSAAAPWLLSSTMAPLAPLPTASAYARAHVRSVLADWHMAALAGSAQLVVSELVTNAVQASTREFGSPSHHDGHMAVIHVRLLADRVRLLIEVYDMAAAPPVVRHPAADDEGGRGLQLVGALTGRWGWLPVHDGPGKCVWAELCLEATSTGEACGVRSRQKPDRTPGEATDRLVGETGPARTGDDAR